MKPVPQKYEDLPTLSDFSKTIPSDYSELWLHKRFGKLIGRFSIDHAVQRFGEKRVFNYFDRKEGCIREIWIG